MLSALWACSDGIEVRYRGRSQVSDTPMRVVRPLMAGEQAHLVAADDDGGLHILPLDGGEACPLPSARAVAFFRRDDAYRLALRVERDDGHDEIRFLDTECKPHLEPAVDAGRTRMDGKVIFAELAGRLVAFDPWEDTQVTVSPLATELGPRAAPTRDRPGGLWLLEEEALVIRSPEGELLEEAARGVTEIGFAHRSDALFVYSNHEGIHSIQSDGEEARRLYDSGCRLRSQLLPPGPKPERHITALSPCEEGTLIAITDLDADEPSIVEFAQGVRRWWTRAAPAGGSLAVFTFYTTQLEQQERSFVARSDGTALELPLQLGDEPTIWPWMGSDGVSEADFGDGHGAWLIIDASHGLGLWTEQDGFKPIHPAAKRLMRTAGGWLVLHDAIDGLGSLSAIAPDTSLEPLARDVLDAGALELEVTPRMAGAVTTLPETAGALMHDMSQGVGTLSALHRAPAELVALAEGVKPSSVDAFYTYLRGASVIAASEPVVSLSLLQSFDAETSTGDLVIVMEGGREFFIDREVANARASDSRQRAGIVYSIPEGKRRGIWFAPQ
ncbi:MAG: hypothetical protein OEZ06_13145 [Myxococcales bacterium]|nr:hypothetical protein [Myxococcales bacterium]